MVWWSNNEMPLCSFLKISVIQSARLGVQRQDDRTDVWSIVGYVVRSANAFLLGLMGTKTSALATGTKRTLRDSLNALEIYFTLSIIFLCSKQDIEAYSLNWILHMVYLMYVSKEISTQVNKWFLLYTYFILFYSYLN